MKNIAINSSTRLYCIFGNPVRHSISPLMQNAAFAEAGIDAVYLAFEPPLIGDALDAMRALGISGASVTIPFKIDVMKHLDDIAPLAAAIGSVNTIVNEDGRLGGHNTDGHGAVTAIEKSGISITDKRCLVIGNGGSARAIALALAGQGARVVIAGRNPERITALARDIGKYAPDASSSLIKDLDSPFMESVDVIINTTPVGMTPDIASIPIDPSLLTSRHTVFDIVYAPHETRLLAEARERGCRVVYGVEMLVLQGARQFEIWTGVDAPVDAMRRAAYKHLHISS